MSGVRVQDEQCELCFTPASSHLRGYEMADRVRRNCTVLCDKAHTSCTKCMLSWKALSKCQTMCPWCRLPVG